MLATSLACILSLRRSRNRGRSVSFFFNCWIVSDGVLFRLLERRVNALLRVGQLASKARTTKQFWTQVGEAIRPYEYDFPAAISYLYREPESSEHLDAQQGPQDQFTLEWTIGYRSDHPEIPQHLYLNEDIGLARAFSNSVKDGPAVLYKEQDGILPSSLYTDLENRGFGDPIKAFLALPIRTYDESAVGFLLVGLNTRRPYDDEYKDWINVLSNLLGASAALVALHEEEAKNRKRQEEQAARDREVLNAEVATLAQEASNAMEKLRSFHEIADQLGLGYFEIDVHGMLIHANVSFSTSPHISIGSRENRRHIWLKLDTGEILSMAHLSPSRSTYMKMTLPL